MIKKLVYIRPYSLNEYSKMFGNVSCRNATAILKKLLVMMRCLYHKHVSKFHSLQYCNTETMYKWKALQKYWHLFFSRIMVTLAQ